MTREPLPLRRRSETFELPFGGLRESHVVTIGFYEDGRIGEVFITGGKSGEAVEAIARDSAVILSLALQFDVPLSIIARAITRDGQGMPQTVVGCIVDLIAKESSACVL